MKRVVLGLFVAGGTPLRVLWERLSAPRASRYGARYRRWVTDSTRYPDTKHVATAGSVSPELDEVYIEAGLALQARPHAQPGPNGASARRRPLWDFLDEAEPVVLAVVGAPGSGKTTLLTQAARRTASTYRERRRGVPVLLHLHDHAKIVIADPEVTLPDLIRRSLPGLPVAEPAEWWESRLAQGHCVVLFDGLDEIAGAAERRAVRTWVDTQISSYPRNDFVIASRTHDDRETSLRSAITLQVLAFNLDQVRRFLHGWYRAVERRPAAGAGRAAANSAQEAADDLLNRLATAPALYDLTSNPLFLTMIAGLHRLGRPLPSRRADLYREVCQVMLGHQPAPGRVDAGAEAEAEVSEEELLTALAFEMMRHGTGAIGRRQLLDGVGKRLRRVSAGTPPEEFIAGVAARGLLVERDGERYWFAHHSFQEYLAARYIDRHDLERVLADAVDDPWWRETTLLYVAEAGPDGIVQAALESGSNNALSLAFECADLGGELASGRRQRLTEVLETGFGDDSERRRLVASVLAGRHLRRLMTTPYGTRICPDPVPGNLYALFRKDTGAPPPDDPVPLDPSRSRPIRGMWSRDAAAFVRWLNSVVSVAGNGTRQTEGVRYRLPTAEELTGLTDLPGLTARMRQSAADRVWCLADGGPAPTIWTRPGLVRGDVVPVDELRDCVTADLHGSTLVAALLARTADRAMRRLGATGGPIGEASRSLAETLESGRSGHRAGDLERHMVTALGIVGSLLGRLREAQQAAVLLDGALRSLGTMDAAAARSIDRAIAAYPIDLAVADLRRVSSMEHDLAVSLDWSRDLGISGAAKVAETIARRVGAAHRRLGKILEAAPGPARHPALEQQLAVDLPGDPGREAEILRTTVAAVLQAPPPADQREAVERFAAALLRAAIPPGSEPIPVDLDRVASLVRRLIPAQPAQSRPAAEPGPSLWIAEVTRRLATAARPILGREHPITPADAQAIRVPALVLAGEAEIAGQPRRAAAFRELAAATCLMSRRAGDSQLLETLIVAGM